MSALIPALIAAAWASVIISIGGTAYCLVLDDHIHMQGSAKPIALWSILGAVTIGIGLVAISVSGG